MFLDIWSTAEQPYSSGVCSVVPGKAWGLQGPKGCDRPPPAPLCAGVPTSTLKSSPDQRPPCIQKEKEKKKKGKKLYSSTWTLGTAQEHRLLPTDGDLVAPELPRGSGGAMHGRGVGAGDTSPTVKELMLWQHPAALCIHCFLPKYNQLFTPNHQT